MDKLSFKTCPMCQKEWETRKNFLDDKDLDIIGYQVNFGKLEAGWFLFNHISNQCNTTLAVEAGKFFDLYNDEIFSQRKTGTDECPGYCLNKSELALCPAKCECAFVREIINMICDRSFKSDIPSKP